MKKNYQIEGIRGIGLCMIMAFHYFFRYNELFSTNIDTNNLLCDFLSLWGTIGVAVFFTISGYLLFISNNLGSTIQQIKKKIRRLYIYYAPAVVIIWVIVCFFKLEGRETTLIDLVLNLIFVNGFLGTPYVDTAHWYLTYLIVFTIIGCLSQKLFGTKRMLIVPLWIVFSIGVRYVAKIVTLDWIKNTLVVCSGGSNVYLFLIGVCLAEITNSKGDRKKIVSNIVYYMVDLAFIYYYFNMTILISTLVVTAVMYFAINQKIKVCEMRLLVFLGGISYTVYLVHQNIGYIIMSRLTPIISYYPAVLIAAIVSIIMGMTLQKFVGFIQK